MSSPSTPNSRSHRVHKSDGSMSSNDLPSTPKRSAGGFGVSSVEGQTLSHDNGSATPSASASLPSPYLRVSAAAKAAASTASPSSTFPPVPAAFKASFLASSSVIAPPQAHHTVAAASPASSTASPNSDPNRMTYTPTRRPSSNTHAGGILPPASFFRPSRPNSTTRPPSAVFSLSTSPVRSSPIGVGLPFKSPTGSPSPASRPPSGLPSSFKPPVAGDPARMAKHSREPLLPIVERKGVLARGRAVAADTSGTSLGTGVGVRGSFERIWKKGMGFAGSPPSTPRRKSLDRKSSVSDTDHENSTEMHEKDLEAGGEEEESRNHYAQDTGTDMEKPGRFTIDDIGDGAVGGGVVMEMGRLSMAETSIISGAVDRTTVIADDDDDEMGVVVDDGIRFKPADAMSAGSHESPRSPRTPGGGAAAVFSFDAPPPVPNPVSPLAVPGTPGQRSRHAHFAPSPTRSPKSMIPPQPISLKISVDIPSAPSPSYLVPILSPQTQKPVRNYEFHPSQNTFFFKGHLLAGGDSPWPFIGALAIVLGIAGTWFGTTCVFWWHRGGGGPAVAAAGAYLCLLTISSMLMTAFRDPGILPRDLDPDPPCAPASSTTSDSMPIPLPRDLRVRAGSVRVKYCVTCKTYRPPRSSHCKMCDNCIDGCDHHCQWVNNCVGRRNYTHFITFVVAASITTLLVLATAMLHIYLLTHDDHLRMREALKKAPGSAVALGMCLVVIWPLLALALYHVRLLLLNITTIEQVRNQAHRKLTGAPTPPNPFTIGRWWHNVAYLLCRPPGYSWVDLPGYAMHDTRKENPGFIVRPASTVEDGDLEEGRESGQWR